MVAGQAAAALVVMALAAMPPARGAMLVVPLGGSAAPALAAGVRLVAAGPLPGSLVVDGDRGALLPYLVRHGLLLFAAPSALCQGASA